MAVGVAMDVPLLDADPVVQLGHAIRGRGRCLLVLDNFEQVSRHARETLGAWLDRAPDAAFLVTTREVLGLPGEAVLALAPLALPDANPATAQEATTSPAVQLFAERAAAASRGWQLGDTDAAAVARIVRLVDGLPLAIELAASRVRVLSPEQIATRLGDRFRLLQSSGARVDRQASLRASLDWSWDLLAAHERAALAQCSVFVGGFALASAEAVLELGTDAEWAVDVVQGLLDQSLLRRMPGDGEPRFGMWVSVQEYAAEKLLAMGGTEAAAERHGAHYALLGADEALYTLDGPGGTARWHLLAAETENLSAACRRAVSRGHAATASATFGAMQAVVDRRGPARTGVDAGLAVLAVPGLDGLARAGVARRTALLLRVVGRMDEARALYEEALAIARGTRPDPGGDRRSEGVALVNLGTVHHEQGRMEEARALYAQALELYREVGYGLGEGVVLGNLGALHNDLGRVDGARTLYEQALAVHREVGNRRGEGVVLGNLGVVHADQGRMDEARALYEQALAVHREVGNRRLEGAVLGNLGNLHADQGHTDEARALHEQALALHREVGNPRFEGFVLLNMGDLDRRSGDLEAARRRLDAADALLRGVADRLGLAGLLCTRARLALDLREGAAARAAIEEAKALAQAVGAGPGSDVARRIAEVEQAVAESGVTPAP